MPAKLKPGDVDVTLQVAVGIDGVNSHFHTVVILILLSSATKSILESLDFEYVRRKRLTYG